ncbi:hypothetical protein PoB_005587100 [Plakobranchus ocellatus]|uniref:Coiled-coil domain-containing protein 86 n=1 Tax=Plakobranchus ocellatus TaxID=259542 RepID=A0AAV4C1X7_9GAST|nr:hypothetical protein PoB_005587100 [Plakobranchus ocellatus]
MEALVKGLRPRKKKAPKLLKIPPLTNAEKCARYRAKVKADPIAHAVWRAKRKEDNKKWREGRTQDQREIMKVEARLRQQKRRAKLKNQLVSNTKISKPKAQVVRAQIKKEPNENQETKIADKRERNRICQQKRRANMSDQRKQYEREKRRNYYYRSKMEKGDLVFQNISKSTVRSKPKGIVSFNITNNTDGGTYSFSSINDSVKKKSREIVRFKLNLLLKGVQSSIERSQSKLALFKLNFIRQLLNRQVPGCGLQRACKRL